MAVVYSLDDTISSFFDENTTVTRQQCDDFALSQVGGKSIPVPIQGDSSYTITAGTAESKIFQFRTHDSDIDMSVLSFAKTTHSQFIPDCKYHGTIGQSRPLHVYEMDRLAGTPYIIARLGFATQSPDDVARQRNTTTDFAKFFAQSWNHSQKLPPDETAALLMEFRDKFDLLSQSLPPRFTSNLDRIRKELPLLFSQTLPFVLTHGDLCELNILTDPETGSITGIIDWAEGRILPFGFSLWGFENVLGWMDSKGWHYFDNRYELEEIFWRTFRMEANNLSDDDLRLIQVARMAGLFCRYGLVHDGKGYKGVVDESDVSSFAYLNAFCTGNDWMPTVGH
ncbi:hypothetical protein F5Y03DRAFT_375862 [Xylaria venustula]|nr:hypothetical protein F5Y03DRAFT_375862 [Xylaria venustula]